jgi:transposase
VTAERGNHGSCAYPGGDRCLHPFGQNNISRLKQSSAHVGITDLRDAAGVVGFTRLILLGVKPKCASTILDYLNRVGSPIAETYVRATSLKKWATAVARRAGMKKAKVALARKLAVVLYK